MAKTKQGFVCPKRFPLRRVLRKWRKLNERIADEWAYCSDVPWWYNERASLSVFAGAVWGTGEFAFEEFSDEKRKVSRRSQKFGRSYAGRVDLYFNLGGKDFIAEAKICWPRCGRLNPKRQTMVEDGLALACSDIRKSKPNGQRRVGILFVTPRWKTNLRHEIDSRIDAWIEKIKAIDCDAISWVFPASARTRKAYGYLTPGTAVLIREV